MAVEARYTEQFPVVCTPATKEALENEAKQSRRSMAAIVREAIDNRYGLVDGEVPPAGVPSQG
jgi:predicted DNA-binding protein